MEFSRFWLVSVGSVTALLLGSPEVKQHSRCNFISVEQRGKITLLDLLGALINTAQDDLPWKDMLEIWLLYGFN